VNLVRSLRRNSSLKEDTDLKSLSHAFKLFQTVSIRLEKKYFLVSTLDVDQVKARVMLIAGRRRFDKRVQIYVPLQSRKIIVIWWN